MSSVPVYARRILFFLYLIVIVWASLSPPDELPRLISFPYFDKVAHFMMYLVFCVAGTWALDNNKAGSSSMGRMIGNATGDSQESELVIPDASVSAKDTKTDSLAKETGGNGWIYFITFLFAIAWGLGMEMLQRAMHLGREYSMGDLAANITGALTGAGLYYFISKRN